MRIPTPGWILAATGLATVAAVAGEYDPDAAVRAEARGGASREARAEERAAVAKDARDAVRTGQVSVGESPQASFEARKGEDRPRKDASATASTER